MILTLVKKLQNKIPSTAVLCIVFCVAFFGLLFQPAYAALDSMSLSISPTLFNMSAVTGQSWDSGIKVINNNKTAITVYAQVVNFAPQGEEGEGKFLPVLEKATEGSTLAEWITISSDPITIPAEQTYSIPFSVTVPNNASPGGHFAAILIGTKPPEEKGSFRVSTSQVVSSLFFVRIAGDVQEEGTIREFRTTKSFFEIPNVDFEVRFENKGNVHLQPQGDIVITNMWGQERGVIPINHETHFGNVLPKSIRKFDFTWKGEQSFTDIGMYKAVVTLAYGEDNRKFVTSTVYFYIVPIKAVTAVLMSIIAFVLFLRWSIKKYVQRMLILAGVETQPLYQRQKRSFVKEGDVLISKKARINAPVESGVNDLKERFKKAHALIDKCKALGSFVLAYKLFFGATLVLLFAIAGATLFVNNAMKKNRDYEVVINNPDTSITLSSEDILHKEQPQHASSTLQMQQATTTQKKEQQYDLILVNSSDTPGQAGLLQNALEAKGYTVAKLQSDFSTPKDKTVIVYDALEQTDALALSKLLNGALLSLRPESDKADKSTITVYIGNDYKTQ